LILLFLNLFSSPAAVPPALPPVSHELWNELLKKYVTLEGNVNYKGLMNEKGKLNSYLDMLGNNPPVELAPAMAKDEQKVKSQAAAAMAYWINTYNAYTIKLILDHYPVKSIRDIDDGKPWDEKFISIGIKRYSLNMIENDILRKKFQDPRIHFAINCASKSCPKLLNEAFNAKDLERQLDDAARSFVNDDSKNKINGDKLELSEVFDWYKADFIATYTGVISFLNKYSQTPIPSTAPVSYLDYDWSLNE